jgi:hypothetical protein
VTDRTAAGQGCSISADELDAVVTKAVRVDQRQPRASRRAGVEWDDMSLAQRRALIRETFESIVLLPSFGAEGRRRQFGDRVTIMARYGGCT